MTRMEPNGLALEYQRDYGTAWRDLDISNLINNPAASGKCRILGFGFEKEISDRLFADFRSFGDYRPYPGLVANDSI